MLFADIGLSTRIYSALSNLFPYELIDKEEIFDLKTKSQEERAHIVMIIPRGEAVRNFLYSDTLKVLSEHARITLLSVIHDERFRDCFGPSVEQIVPLNHQLERRLLRVFRKLLWEAHFRWLGSKVAHNTWELRALKTQTVRKRAKWFLYETVATALANRPSLEKLTQLERYLSWRWRTSDHFVRLFQALKPDLVFNGSHIHGPAGELPAKIAHRLGIPTAGFIFSWDNLTSRSRIFVPYDYYFVWHEAMKEQLLNIYPKVNPAHVYVTGTPQFDFHFKSEFQLTREQLAREIGFDPARPFISYTTGVDRHFPDEHKHVEFIARFLNKANFDPRPQLVVRTYVKGTSSEMKALAAKKLPGVIFPEVKWDERWYMPMYEDLAIYTSCLRHAAMGINPASTVSLELMMFDKPVMNIGFDPPGSELPHALRWQRHIEFDHYKPVADSGGVMVAYSIEDMQRMIRCGLQQPRRDSAERQQFLQQTFLGTLDGGSGRRVAQHLLTLAHTGRQL